MKINLAVFFGCRSVEHEVSIISAVQAMRSINKEKYNVIPVYVTKKGVMYTGDKLFDIASYKDIPSLLNSCRRVNIFREESGVIMEDAVKKAFKKAGRTTLDVAFPIVHGTNCEDGSIQGFFEFLDIPYVGCDVISSAVGMDKAVFKDVLKRFGLPVLSCRTYYSRDYIADREAVIKEIEEEIGYPMIIKPVNLGSSVGISKVESAAELNDALELAVSYADKFLAEKAVENLREINCSVLGDSAEAVASTLEEPVMNDKILSYEDKYMSGAKNKSGSKSAGMASLSRKIPADLTKEQTEYVKDLSVKIFKALGCSGVVRIDYLMDNKTGEIYANEINTIPGSLSFYLWDASGVKYTDQLDRMISLAFSRQRNRENLAFTIDTNLLSTVNLGGSKGAKGSKM